MNDFYLWQTLSQTAVVGTGKAALPPPLLGFFAAKGMDVHTSPEETLLAAAALVQLRIRAGRQFPRWEGPVPEAVSMGPGAINDRAGRSLAAILSGRFAPALGEWLELFAASGLSLPPEGLPGLLDRCLEDKAIRRQIEPFLDERAHWLIRQNPAWAALTTPLAGKPEKEARVAWTDTYARGWIADLQQSLALSGKENWSLWSYREKLRDAAYCVPPVAGAPWLEGWEQVSPQTVYVWKNDIDYFLRAVHFRIEMHDAFTLKS